MELDEKTKPTYPNMPTEDGKKGARNIPKGQSTKYQDKGDNELGGHVSAGRQPEMEMGRPRGEAPKHQMGIRSNNVDPSHREETPRQTRNEMGGHL